MKNTNNNWRLERAKKIVELIHTGVENEDGDIREFNILDYYKIINISPKALYEGTAADLKEEYSEEEVNKFRSFVLRSLDDKKAKIKEIMSINHTVMINDELRVITDEEKINVIGYLKQNKIPLTNDTYAIVLKRYLYEGLDLQNIEVPENKKGKVLVR